MQQAFTGLGKVRYHRMMKQLTRSCCVATCLVLLTISVTWRRDLIRWDNREEETYESCSRETLSFTRYNRLSAIFQLRDSVFDCASKRVRYTLQQPRCPHPMPRVDVVAGAVNGGQEKSDARQRSFVNIFRTKVWKGQKVEENAEKLTGSGRGSTLAASAKARVILHTVIDLVKEFLGKERITMLDIPCGDMTWMPLVVQNRTDVYYTGMDIVPDLIESHQKHYRDYTHMNFIQGDVVAKGLNRSYDLIFTREMTQHLRNADCLQLFRHISESHSEFLLATSIPNVRKNTDVEIVIRKKALRDLRRYRKQNLETAPFHFGKPLCLAHDIDDEHLNLWKLPLYSDSEP